MVREKSKGQEKVEVADIVAYIIDDTFYHINCAKSIVGDEQLDFEKLVSFDEFLKKGCYYKCPKCGKVIL